MAAARLPGYFSSSVIAPRLPLNVFPSCGSESRLLVQSVGVAGGQMRHLAAKTRFRPAARDESSTFRCVSALNGSRHDS